VKRVALTAAALLAGPTATGVERFAAPKFQHHYGLLTDDYAPKPAFAAYGRLVAQLAPRP
jgi:hypothetical protein